MQLRQPKNVVEATQVFLQCVVLSPDPTFSRGETVRWTKSIFLGKCTVLRQCNLEMFKTFCGQPELWILEWTWTNFSVVREVLRNNYQPHNLIGPYQSLRNSTSFTRLFLTKSCVQATWAWANVAQYQEWSLSVVSVSLLYDNKRQSRTISRGKSYPIDVLLR